jgi:hypothetical protein
MHRGYYPGTARVAMAARKDGASNGSAGRAEGLRERGELVHGRFAMGVRSDAGSLLTTNIAVLTRAAGAALIS